MRRCAPGNGPASNMKHQFGHLTESKTRASLRSGNCPDVLGTAVQINRNPHDKGNLSLFGNNPLTHQLISEQFTSEYRVKTEGRGRKVDEWKLRPEAHDNHWLDGVVGCAVAASIEGAVLPGTQDSGPAPRQRVKRSALKRQPRAGANRS